MWSYIREADINLTDDSADEQYGGTFIEQCGGAPSLRSQTKAVVVVYLLLAHLYKFTIYPPPDPH